MPFIKPIKPHACNLPKVDDSLIRSRGIGTQWYCSKCKKVYELTTDGYGGIKAAVWKDTGELFTKSSDMDFHD